MVPRCFLETIQTIKSIRKLSRGIMLSPRNQSPPGGGYLTRAVTGCVENLSTPCIISHKKWAKGIPSRIQISRLRNRVEIEFLLAIPCRIIFLPIIIPCRIILTAKGHPVERHIPSGQVWEYPPSEGIDKEQSILM